MGQLVDGKWRTENILVQHDDRGSISNETLSSATASATKPGFLPSLGDTTSTARSRVRGLTAPR